LPAFLPALLLDEDQESRIRPLNCFSAGRIKEFAEMVDISFQRGSSAISR